MNPLTAWLLTATLHGVVLLSLAWLVDRLVASRPRAWRELLWRTGLFGAALTATVQLAAPASLLADWHWRASSVAVPAQFQRAPQASTAITRPSPARQTNPSAPHIAATAQAIVSPAVGSAPARRPPAQAPLDWLLALWLVGAAFALTRVAVQALRLRSDLAQAVPVQRADVLDELDALAGRIPNVRPCVLSLDGLPSPIATAGARIVLPAWAIQTLGRAQLRAMLAHELGHIARHDPSWKLLTACWRALFWFVPLAGVAQRRLDALAELACDAFAAAHTGDARSLAECLATCAEHQVRGPSFVLAPAMAARPSSLAERVERLVEGVPVVETLSSIRISRVAAALVLAGGVFCLPAVGFDAARAQQLAPKDAGNSTSSRPSHVSISVNSDGGRDTMTVSLGDDDGHKFNARVEGKITFNDAETAVTGLGPGGTATFEETRDGMTRRLELAERDGKLERRYFVDRSERPFDAAAQAWQASVVKQLLRSGIDAEGRTRRLYAKGGAALVLDEIGQLPTDYTRGVYLQTLVGLGKLTPAQLDRAVKLAGAMGSDYERRQALTAIFAKQSLEPSEQVTFLRQALRFDSDYDLAELLIAALPKLADTDAVRQAWLDASLKIASDYERRRTLQAMLARGGLDAAEVARVIDASSSMGSDYERRELLVAAAQELHDPNAIAVAYAHSAQAIGSDYERREALLALLRSGPVGVAGANAVLEAAATIGSSYECREVLVALARVMPDDANLQQHYRAVAGKLPDYDRGEAEQALVR